MPEHDSVVVIPVYKPVLSPTELMALERCLDVLSDHPVVLVAPDSLDLRQYMAVSDRLSPERFPDGFFASLESYSELLLSEDFYERFRSHEYMLIHQLDAFVFSDSLDAWCGRGYDYIGAPWRDASGMNWTGVGNGGFSLRRIEAFLDVFHSPLREDPEGYLAHVKAFVPGKLSRALRYHRVVLNRLGRRDDVSGFLRRFITKGCPEDMFWGSHARRFLPSYRVAPVEDALLFSIEAGLMAAFPHYNGTPPFGCHRQWFLDMIYAYSRSDREPKSDYERAVWELARMAGMERARKGA